MFTSNPFAELATFLSPQFMQVYVILMIIAVAAGTLLDMLHKSSVLYFFRDWKKSNARAIRKVGGGEAISLAIRTLLKEVITSGEFCNPMRRISHLFMFYGFILYLIATIVMVFAYPTPDAATPALWPVLWNIGIIMVMIGGYWFFFIIRVDVAHEGHSPFRLVRADLFIVSLLASVTFGLIWEIMQATSGMLATRILFAIYIFFTTVLFMGVAWSKFPHMFYKPAAAFQKRMQQANGSTTLPTPAARNEGR